MTSRYPDRAYLDRAYLGELSRPWKLASFGVGMAWLLHGAVEFGISDWDVGISLLMGGLTYVCAPWSVAALFSAARHRTRVWVRPAVMALFVAWVVVDGVYIAYHTLMGNQMFRAENFRASAALYFLAGSIWLYRGSMRDMASNVRRLLRTTRSNSAGP